MAAIPTVFVGRNTSSIAFVPQSVAADGTLSDGTSRSIIGVSQKVTLNQENTLEEISAINSRRRNNVIVDSGSQYSVEGFILSNDSTGTPTNWPENIFNNNDYVKVTHSRAGITATFYGVVKDYRVEYNKGKCPFSLSLEMVDSGAANPGFA